MPLCFRKLNSNKIDLTYLDALKLRNLSKFDYTNKKINMLQSLNTALKCIK